MNLMCRRLVTVMTNSLSFEHRWIPRCGTRSSRHDSLRENFEIAVQGPTESGNGPERFICCNHEQSLPMPVGSASAAGAGVIHHWDHPG
jgi:hypothetical protein